MPEERFHGQPSYDHYFPHPSPSPAQLGGLRPLRYGDEMDYVSMLRMSRITCEVRSRETRVRQTTSGSCGQGRVQPDQGILGKLEHGIIIITTDVRRRWNRYTTEDKSDDHARQTFTLGVTSDATSGARWNGLAVIISVMFLLYPIVPRAGA